jgi:hypothetical protein
MRYNNIHSQTVAGEVPGEKQRAMDGLSGP